MERLFKMDIKNYSKSDIAVSRPSARAVIWAGDDKLAMVYSRRYKYYKFPGGGICSDEDKKEALAREVHEETGLVVKMDSIREYGSVLRSQKSGRQGNTVFEQENFYYLCSVDAVGEQELDEYEKEAEFELQYVSAGDAIAVNKACAIEDEFMNTTKKAEPGEVLDVGKDYFSVQTGQGILMVKEVQLQGKKRMGTDAFLRGNALDSGMIFQSWQK